MSLTRFAAVFLLGASWAVAAFPTEGRQTPLLAEGDGISDSSTLERRLQHLSWVQFRRVVEAVPKLKASVDAYGPLGWEYVRANYSTYRWRKNIDRLDVAERRQLAELIDQASAAR
ncbi:hypothetical protein [Sulfuricystis multivorans]|uniref:hypothetical protein n=1 Tax=Sulfuricystis multivorans TaxID=2211108 RepID=UPI000F81F9E1|nr:hypothetical protein [Sulfuricystis multivorans]